MLFFFCHTDFLFPFQYPYVSIFIYYKLMIIFFYYKCRFFLKLNIKKQSKQTYLWNALGKAYPIVQRLEPFARSRQLKFRYSLGECRSRIGLFCFQGKWPNPQAIGLKCKRPFLCWCQKKSRLYFSGLTCQHDVSIQIILLCPGTLTTS